MFLSGGAAVGVQPAASVQYAVVATGWIVLVGFLVSAWGVRLLFRNRETRRLFKPGHVSTSGSTKTTAPEDPLARLRAWHDSQSESRRLRISRPTPAANLVPLFADRTTVRLRRRSAGMGALALQPSFAGQFDGRHGDFRRGWPSEHKRDSGLAVRVLGPILITGAPHRLTVQQTALLTLLAVLGPQTRERLIDRIWNGQAVSLSRFANLITEIRGVVGKQRLTLREADGCYQLNGISCDYLQFDDLLHITSVENADSETAAALTQALRLVRGQLFEHRNSRYWHWLDNEHHLFFEVGRSVATAAAQLAEMAARSGDHTTAIWACRQGLLAVPGDEQLLGLAERLYATRIEP